MKEIKLKFNKKIGINHPCFIIAEIGVNHNGKLSLAKKLIDKSKDAGADAVKFQTFQTEQIILKNSPKARYHIETTGSDKKQSWYNLLKTQEISLKMHNEIIKYCNKLKIIFISTPYDFESVELLEKLNVSIFKIASCDLNNHPLIDRVANSKKPIIISTGMSNFNEVQETYNKFKKKNIVLLQCTGNYPADKKEANINVIDTYKNKFNCLLGYSDHQTNNYAALAAISKGAKVYEKHITLDKNMSGPDHRASYEPEEFKKLVNEIRNIEITLGSKKKHVTENEKKNIKKMRKFLVAKKDIKKNEKFSNKNIAFKRTGGYGLEPNYFYILKKKSSKKIIKKDQPITNSQLK